MPTSRRVLGRIVSVPDTWEAWSQRVMTIVMAVLLATTMWLTAIVQGIDDYQRESRQQRITYQHEQVERECLILRLHDVPVETRTALGC